MNFLDEQRMSHLYEKFILEYYRKEYPQFVVNASQIPWQLDDNENRALPIMQTDVTINYKEKTLIIDAKYYSQAMQYQFNAATIHSGNLYQIFTYVKNKEIQLQRQKHEVSGMLLYAKTDEELYPHNEYKMSGNRIAVRTLDLSKNFSVIKAQLNNIVQEYMQL
jgi:5-methylcytosine-specific restriction enzyme subunit McrC